MGEFELIENLFRPLAERLRHPDLILGPGDDCAIQSLSPGHQLVFSVDTLVEGVHFPLHYDPRSLGWRALAVAVSDLAAMGADPVCFTLALTLPDARESWLRPFTEGLADAAVAFGIALAGGDTTRGPLTLSVQVHGTVPAGLALVRSGARVGDLICVTGELGGAAAALALLDKPPTTRVSEALLIRYHHPQPRLSAGQWLRGKASACIDVSDGLLADLGHILKASGVGGRVEVASLPVMAGADLQQALAGGDDYELCFTLPPEHRDVLSRYVGVGFTVIGEVAAGRELRLIQPGGQAQTVGAHRGYDHFGTADDH